MASRLLIAALLTLLALPLWAAPDGGLGRDGYVTDPLNLLALDDEAALEGQLADVEAVTGYEMVIALNSVPANSNISDSARSLLAAWKVGGKDNRRAVMILLAPNLSRAHILAGNDFVTRTNPGQLQQLEEKLLMPALEGGQLAPSLSLAVAQLTLIAKQAPGNHNSAKKSLADYSYALLALLGLLSLALLLAYLRKYWHDHKQSR